MLRKYSAILYGLAILGIMLLLIPKYAYNDPDTFWHIELGNYMLEHQTVLHHAIHTFYQDKLPYVPHEFGFQIVVAILYKAFGWPGLYLLAAVCLYLLLAGMIRLMRVSRKEKGILTDSPLMLPFALLMVAWIYYNYFKMRPQMISAVMIVWFLVYLREYRLEAKKRYAAALIVLSCAIANFHAGVWLVSAVFAGMVLLESIVTRRFTRKLCFLIVSIWLAGLVNPGGLGSLFYIFTVTKNHFNLLINEWQPIAFGQTDSLPIMLLLLFFTLTLPHSLNRMPFRYFLAAGLLYLGVANFKQNLFLWLFTPYFAAAFLDALPVLRSIRLRTFSTSLKLWVIAGLVLNTAFIFIWPPQIDKKSYPVEEMSYIMDHAKTGIRPKVFARYGASGYVMSHGADVLCDGRQDPFVTEASRGALGWTAFERSMYGFSEYLPDIVAADKPDYLIVHYGVSQKLIDNWTKLYGQPVFKGTFGIVYDFTKIKSLTAS